MSAEQLDLTLEGSGAHGDILPSNFYKVKAICPQTLSFLSCKRRTIGLRETRTKERLLDIEYGQRETFAYSCKAYACVVARAKSPAERKALPADYGSKVRISEERVDPAEVASIVAEAASARNGWKVLLARCAPTTKPRSARELAREATAARNSAEV